MTEGWKCATEMRTEFASTTSSASSNPVLVSLLTLLGRNAYDVNERKTRHHSFKPIK